MTLIIVSDHICLLWQAHKHYYMCHGKATIKHIIQSRLGCGFPSLPTD